MLIIIKLIINSFNTLPTIFLAIDRQSIRKNTERK
jgi:hypothetical protein